MVFVNTTLETSLARNEQRARTVPVPVVTKDWNLVQKNLREYKGLFGSKNFRELSNDAVLSPQQVVAKLTPELTRMAMPLLNAPVSNPIGKKWMEKERELPGSGGMGQLAASYDGDDEPMLDEDIILALGALGSVAAGAILSKLAIGLKRTVQDVMKLSKQGKESAAEKALSKMTDKDRKTIEALLSAETRALGHPNPKGVSPSRKKAPSRKRSMREDLTVTEIECLYADEMADALQIAIRLNPQDVHRVAEHFGTFEAAVEAGEFERAELLYGAIIEALPLDDVTERSMHDRHTQVRNARRGTTKEIQKGAKNKGQVRAENRKKRIASRSKSKMTSSRVKRTATRALSMASESGHCVQDPVDEGTDTAVRMGIVNPNSSGQGPHPDHAKNPYHKVLEAAGFSYSHTTPVGHGREDFRLHHTYRLNKNFAVSVYPGKSGWIWEGSKSGSGRMQQGKDAAKLKQYLAGAVKRHRMEDLDESDSVVQRIHAVLSKSGKALTADQIADLLKMPKTGVDSRGHGRMDVRDQLKGMSVPYAPKGKRVKQTGKTYTAESLDEGLTDEQEAAVLLEVSPPGWEARVKKMKRDPDIKNPWQLAWYLHNKEKGKKESVDESVDEMDAEFHEDGGISVHQTSETLRPGKMFVVVDTSVPGGRMIGEIITGVQKADKLAAKYAAKGDRVQVIDALWYGPAREKLVASGVLPESLDEATPGNERAMWVYLRKMSDREAQPLQMRWDGRVLGKGFVTITPPSEMSAARFRKLSKTIEKKFGSENVTLTNGKVVVRPQMPTYESIDEDTNAHGVAFTPRQLLAMWEDEDEATRGTFEEWRAHNFDPQLDEAASKVELTSQISKEGNSVRMKISGSVGKIALRGTVRPLHMHLEGAGSFKAADSDTTVNRDGGGSVPYATRRKVVDAVVHERQKQFEIWKRKNESLDEALSPSDKKGIVAHLTKAGYKSWADSFKAAWAKGKGPSTESGVFAELNQAIKSGRGQKKASAAALGKGKGDVALMGNIATNAVSTSTARAALDSLATYLTHESAL
jgi:hypothetical protein